MSSNKEKRTILLVEDEAILAMAETRVLEKHGYKIISALNGERAVDIALNTPGIDLILMDIDLGRGMDGTTAAEIILKQRDLPVVFLSSHTEPAVVEKTEEITSYGYVTKSSGETVLLASIKMAFRLFESKQESRKHEQKMRLTAQHLREAQEIAGLGRWDYYHENDRLEWSEAIFTLFETDSNEFEASLQGFLDRIYPDDRERVLEAWTASLRDRQPYTIEHRLLLADGRIKWVAEKCRTDFDKDGVPVHSVGIVQDITERRATQDTMQSILYELNKSQEVAKVGNWIWHIPENRVEWSDEMYRIFGIEKESFSGNLAQVLTESIHPDDRAEVDRSNASVVESNTPIPVEYRIVRPDGTIRSVWAEAGELELDSAGKPLLLRGIVHDITRQKEAEQFLRISQKALSASMDAIALADLNGNLTYVNPAFLSLWAYESDDQVLGQPAINFWELGDKAQMVVEELREVGSWQGELSARRSDQSSFEVQLGSSMVTDDKGVPICMMGVFRDISGQKRKEAKIKNLLEEKELILKETHHRIKNNYTTVEYLLKLQSEQADLPEVKSALQVAKSRISSMRFLYDKLLRADQYQLVSSRPYLEDLGATILAAHSTSGLISLETAIEDLKIDAERIVPIGAIVTELMINSLKHAFGPGAAGSISLSLACQDGKGTLCVGDDGRGMPEEFDFQTTESFGLTLVRMMAEQIEGTLSTQSRTRGGTLFTVEFAV